MLLKSTELELESWRSIRGLRLQKLIGKEALFVISGLKRFEDDEEKLGKFVNAHVLRLLKMDMIAVLTELERQEEVALAIKVSNFFYGRCEMGLRGLHAMYLVECLTQCVILGTFSNALSICLTVSEATLSFIVLNVIQKQDWYKPDVYPYKDLIIALARSKKMEDVMLLWDSMKKEDLFPDSQTYTEVIRGFLNSGWDMKLSPDPPEELPFRILLKGLLPHPLLRNRVKQDFEELFPEQHVYDPPEEIFGMCG
ncbi:pentatricopeptide repeat-containing protein [Pyrus ussuriensis x Pyrus communis]|uniref:Pentatricopeptide repeat-containing protein n=1 Tax=Pyrus ussuriensis x Pyrus communis TaxID=2448454 RepID=A0A5N5FD16_9ROSA|nr:pentatricopeptide repeat-containing protein [Pyrus ussuriensis x Pyrus communis]